MPTVHKWKPYASGYIGDAAQFSDGTSLLPGDTIIVNNGNPNAASTGTSIATLTSGTYQFEITGANSGLVLDNIQLGGASAINVTGPGQLTWTARGQFVNDGIVRVGSKETWGNVAYNLYGDPNSNAGGAFVNDGTLVVQNGSLMSIYPGAYSNQGGVLFNAAGGVFNIKSGGGLIVSRAYGYLETGTNNGSLRNDGLINVTGGTAERNVYFNLQTTYAGTGLVSIRGTPGSVNPPDTTVVAAGSASGTFDIASGKLDFKGRANTATVNFLDKAGELELEPPGASDGNALFTGTINGFQAGDVIWLDGGRYSALGSAATERLHRQRGRHRRAHGLFGQQRARRRPGIELPGRRHGRGRRAGYLLPRRPSGWLHLGHAGQLPWRRQPDVVGLRAGPERDDLVARRRGSRRERGDLARRHRGRWHGVERFRHFRRPVARRLAIQAHRQQRDR